MFFYQEGGPPSPLLRPIHGLKSILTPQKVTNSLLFLLSGSDWLKDRRILLIVLQRDLVDDALGWGGVLVFKHFLVEVGNP